MWYCSFMFFKQLQELHVLGIEMSWCRHRCMFSAILTLDHLLHKIMSIPRILTCSNILTLRPRCLSNEILKIKKTQTNQFNDVHFVYLI